MVVRYLMTRTWIAGVSLLVATTAAAIAYLDLRLGYRLFCSGLTVPRGANVAHAWKLVGASGIAGLLGLLALRLASQRRGLLFGLLVLEASTLTIAIGLVVADSATYAVRIPNYACLSDNDPPLVVHHVGWLYAAWGVPLVFVLLRAYGAWKGIERPDADELRERHRSNFSLPPA